MGLSFRPNPDSPTARRSTDHLVMSGRLCVGRIYKRDSSRPDSQWLWAINGVQRAEDKVMRVAGQTSTLDEAEAELKENWLKWLAWAQLQERGGAPVDVGQAGGNSNSPAWESADR